MATILDTDHTTEPRAIDPRPGHYGELLLLAFLAVGLLACPVIVLASIIL